MSRERFSVFPCRARQAIARFGFVGPENGDCQTYMNFYFETGEDQALLVLYRKAGTQLAVQVLAQGRSVGCPHKYAASRCPSSRFEISRRLSARTESTEDR